MRGQWVPVLTFRVTSRMIFRRSLTTTSLAILAGLFLCMKVEARTQAQQKTDAPSQASADASGQFIGKLEGQNVAEVRVIIETGEVEADNPADLPLVAGHPYDSEGVRLSLKKLFAKGDYADMRAEATEVQGGVRVDFVVRRNLYIGVVRVEGLAEPPTESTVFAALRLSVGQPFRESELDEAVTRLKEALAQDGLYQAQVQAEQTPDPSTRRMNIVVRITAGPRARVGAISLHNLTSYPDQNVLARLKLKAGSEITSQKLQNAAARLRTYLMKNDYLGARATLRRGDYDAKTNLLPLTLETVTGIRVRVEVVGAKIPDKELRKRVPVFEEGTVDSDLLLEGERALRDFFQRQGYFEAQVDYKTVEMPALDNSTQNKKDAKLAEQVITYTVDRGPRQRLVGVSFDGQKYFGSSQLRSQLSILPAAFNSPGRFSQRLLESDLDAVRNLYSVNGFLDAVVKDEIEQDYAGKENNLFVHIHVEEGQQTLVDKLTVTGNKAVSEKELLDKIGSSAGEPYSEANVTSDRDNILALYYAKGFPNAKFTATKDTTVPVAGGKKGDNRPRIALAYKIEEGDQIHVTRVLIGGYERTRRGVIAREIQVNQGEPLREGDVIETQRRLYNLGIFNRVTLAPQNPDGTDPDKAVDVVVEEAKRYTMAYGGGIELQRLGNSGPAASALEASPRVTFEITKANLTGRADSLSFKIRGSTLQGRALLSYTAPHYFGKPNFSFTATFFADKSRDVTTFTSTRYEGSLQLEQHVSRTTEMFYRYAYRKVLVDASSLQIAPEEIPLFSQPTQVSEFEVSWVRDHRDNPGDATKGTFNSVDAALAGKPIGSSANFLRIFAQNTTYHPIGKRLVFVRATRFGVQRTLGNTLSTEIPLPERFFAGGGTSLRGFGLNQAGPRDPVTGFPVGGQAMLVFNQELRFPMNLPRIGTKLGGALFYDAGNVFSRLGTITARTSPLASSQASGELSYLSHTVGLGFRYNTPVGPVRVDFAYQLNPAQFFVPCTIGNPGCGINGTQLTRLPHFQFFFNLGDVF